MLTHPKATTIAIAAEVRVFLESFMVLVLFYFMGKIVFQIIDIFGFTYMMVSLAFCYKKI